MKRTLLALVAFAVGMAAFSCFAAKVTAALSKPDLEAIKEAVIDEDSEYYYPTLLRKFLTEDTTMRADEFQYFYYGALFQEDYDPYRPSPSPEKLDQMANLMNKKEKGQEWNRAEKKFVVDYAKEMIKDNPVNLRHLSNYIYVCQKSGKTECARVWQYKLNQLLLVIAASGNGTDRDNAWVVVYPQDEYDFLNLSGITIKDVKFESPYDHVVVNPRTPTSPTEYYFNIGELLNQYYLKHPSEK